VGFLLFPPNALGVAKKIKGSVKIQREKWFQYQIEFLGRIDQSYSKRRSEEIKSIKEIYPL